MLTPMNSTWILPSSHWFVSGWNRKTSCFQRANSPESLEIIKACGPTSSNQLDHLTVKLTGLFHSMEVSAFRRIEDQGPNYQNSCWDTHNLGPIVFWHLIQPGHSILRTRLCRVYWSSIMMVRHIIRHSDSQQTMMIITSDVTDNVWKWQRWRHYMQESLTLRQRVLMSVTWANTSGTPSLTPPVVTYLSRRPLVVNNHIIHGRPL